MLNKAGLASVAAITLCIFVSACSQERPTTDKPIVKINNYSMSEHKFKSNILATLKLYGDMTLSEDDKKIFLDQEIERELIIQEAVRRGLDQDESFRNTIERFWEQSLITSLLKLEASKIEKSVLVTEEDIIALHKQLCQTNGDCPPLETQKNQLAKQVLEEKKQMALDSWLSELRKQASITVYEDNLKNMR